MDKTKTVQTSSDAAGVSQTGGVGGTTVGNEGDGPTPPGMDPRAWKRVTWPPDLCGLEDDDETGKVWQGPQRLRECILSPEEKQRCQGIIDQVFAIESIKGVRIAFPPDDVWFVMTKIHEYLKNEPMLIEDIPVDIQIVGDLHGQLYDLDRIFEADAKDGKPGWECGKYIFLGDYVDRGRQSLEIVMGLFCIKMLFPDNIFLLRGNHEFILVNSVYGFFRDFLYRYVQETAEQLFYAVNSAFCWLSIAAIVGDKYLCVHGGISPTAFTRRQFRGLHKPIINSLEDVLINDTVWADPAIGLEGTCFNKDRGTSIYFGLDALVHALHSMQVVVVVRGHTRVAEGFENNWWCLYTVFSATDHGEKMNKGATAIIDKEGKIGFRVFAVDSGRSAFERKLRRYKRTWERNRIEEGKESIQRSDSIEIGDDITTLDYDPDGIKSFLVPEKGGQK